MNASATTARPTIATANEVREANLAIRAQVARRIIGQDEVVGLLVAGFFAGGHCLLVGVPGLAKTLLIRSFSDALGLDFNRIQFTPDLMPSDITGTDVINSVGEADRGFTFLSGPIFSNIILADEINRTPPKTQSALLEAMEEYQITVAGRAWKLPRPFFVMATQNPIEQEGTYALPLAALDRFIFNLKVDYPSETEEMNMLFATTSRDENPVKSVVTAEQVTSMLNFVRTVAISEPMLTYATRIVRESRPEQSSLLWVKDLIEVGGSPRAIQALILGAKATAALDGRLEVQGRDIRSVAKPALRHRIVPSFHASADGIEPDNIVERLLASVPRPAGDPADPAPVVKRKSLLEWILGAPKRRSRKT